MPVSKLGLNSFNNPTAHLRHNGEATWLSTQLLSCLLVFVQDGNDADVVSKLLEQRQRVCR